jgi:5'-nucleotidase
MRILVTNDDGIHAPGLAALVCAARAFGEVVVVAPSIERSGVGHGITLTHPLRATPARVADGISGYAVSGTPADCIKLAISGDLVARPDVVFSGVNLGHNIGIHVFYSGTVAAALEGAMLGVPAVAFSVDFSERPDFRAAAEVGCEAVRPLVERMARGGECPAALNVNVPATPRERLRGVRVAAQCRQPFREVMERRKDPRGREYYWLSGGGSPEEPEAGSDLAAFRQDYVTVTPLFFDVTDRDWLDRLRPEDLGDIRRTCERP